MTDNLEAIREFSPENHLFVSQTRDDIASLRKNNGRPEDISCLEEICDLVTRGVLDDVEEAKKWFIIRESFPEFRAKAEHELNNIARAGQIDLKKVFQELT